MFNALVRYTRALAVAVCVLALPLAASAQTKPAVTDLGTQPKTFLFVGNSFYYYNNSMHNYFLQLARAGESKIAKELRGTSATISGSGLNWHKWTHTSAAAWRRIRSSATTKWCSTSSTGPSTS